MQLRAVTKSVHAADLGFGKSYMEYLIDQELFKPVNGEYNEQFIVRLYENYRSHPHILKVPNELFYNGSLQPSAPAGMIFIYDFF